MNQAIFALGIMILLVGGGIYMGGIVDPSICGSGNCTANWIFHFLFGGAAIVGALTMLVGVLLNEGGKK